ncbi:hypothetical protein [Saccharothrix sp. HUAS TT1]|uniref:hypothetical protein n=1 Tax=unclassified Saccharothrix TaxID=2593673 RepID=UPI00345BC684
MNVGYEYSSTCWPSTRAAMCRTVAGAGIIALCLPITPSTQVEGAQVQDLETLTDAAVIHRGIDQDRMMTGCAAPTGYLGVTNAFALLRLLPMSDRDKDTEILALRHQLTILERQSATPVRGSPPATGHSSRRCRTDSRSTHFVGSAY